MILIKNFPCSDFLTKFALSWDNMIFDFGIELGEDLDSINLPNCAVPTDFQRKENNQQQRNNHERRKQ